MPPQLVEVYTILFGGFTMALVIFKNKEVDFVPFSERGQENPFTVTIRPMDARVLAKLDDGYVTFVNDEGVTLQQGTYNLKAVKYGVVSWKNLNDEDGKEYKVAKNAKGEILDECIGMLPSHIVSELATAIISLSKYPDSAEALLGIGDAK